MKTKLNGCTRIVIVLKKVVIKIPNFLYEWQHFLKGLLANMTERNTWYWNSGTHEKGESYLLCPVLWCSWGGWLLIMKKVDRCLEYEEYDKYDISEHIKCFPGDDTVSNYGILMNKVVKLDYGS